MALACDLAIDTGNGTQLVRVVHGNQFDQYNAFDDPRSPVDTPLGHHVVRAGAARAGRPATSPARCWRGSGGSTATRPRSWGRACCTGWWPAGCGGWRCRSRRRCCCASCPSCPASSRCCSHHAERWLIGFGILVVVIAVIAAVTAIAHHAAGQPRAGRRLDRRARRRGGAQRAVRAEAARLITEGYAGPGHRPHPRAGDLPGRRRVLRQHRVQHRGGAGAQGPVRAAHPVPGRPAAVDGRADRRPGAVGVAVAGRAAHRPPGRPGAAGARAASRPARPRSRSSAAFPDGSTWPIAERALLPWVRRRRIRRVAACGLLVAGVLNVVLALLWSVHWVRAGRLAGCRSASIPPAGSRPSSAAWRWPGWPAASGSATAGPGWRPWSCCWRARSTGWCTTSGLEGLGHRLPVRRVAAARAPSLPGQPGRPAPVRGLRHHDQLRGGGPGHRAGRGLRAGPARPATW